MGNGKQDRIILKGGDERVRANAHGRDKGVIKGTSGFDLIYVDDGDTYTHRLMATRVRVSASASGALNSQEITHEKNLVDARRETEAFVSAVSDLGEKLGPLLLQLPPSFDVEGMGVLEDFLNTLPDGFRYAVEVRHRSWLRSDLAALLREHGAALVLVDYPRMPRMEEATADFSYIRWLGDRREFPSGHTHLKKERDEDLRWWSGLAGRFLEEGKTVFGYANNHYQNHSPSTLRKFVEIRRGG